jgi:hypothetical protein
MSMTRYRAVHLCNDDPATKELRYPAVYIAEQVEPILAWVWQEREHLKKHRSGDSPLTIQKLTELLGGWEPEEAGK